MSDVARSHTFYVDGFGWYPELYVPGEVLMIRAGDKLVLSLWAEAGFESEVGPIRRGPGVVPMTLAHNVPTEAEVDEILAVARSLGAETQWTRAPRVGRLDRLLRRPRRLPLGDRLQPRRDRAAGAALTCRGGREVMRTGCHGSQPA